MPDPYLYEDVPVLRNKLGIKTEKTLDVVCTIDHTQPGAAVPAHKYSPRIVHVIYSALVTGL